MICDGEGITLERMGWSENDESSSMTVVGGEEEG